MTGTPKQHATASVPAWIARVAVALTLVGVPARVFASGGPIFDALYTELRWTGEPVAIALDRAVIGMMLIGSLLVLSPRPRLGLLFGGTGLGLTMLASTILELRWQALVPMEQALRWTTPWILLLWLDRRGRPMADRSSAALECLRVASAATFAGHGIEALARNPHFVDLLFSFARSTGGIRLDLPVAETLLRVIGILDLTVAVLVVVTRSLPVVAWMALWGLATALARVIHAGLGAWPEVLMRSVHFGIPLALLVVFANSLQRATDPAARLSPHHAPTN